MATWYECKFKYNREDQNGGFTTVTEVYLIDAVSFTDAETRVYQEIGSNYQEFILVSVKKYRLHELVYKEDAFKWYKCKVGITTLDEKSGKERKSKQTILVSGNSVKDAYDAVEELFADSVSDYEILDIVTTSIVEVMPYFEDLEVVNEEIAEDELMDVNHASEEVSSEEIVADAVVSEELVDNLEEEAE